MPLLDPHARIVDGCPSTILATRLNISRRPAVSSLSDSGVLSQTAVSSLSDSDVLPLRQRCPLSQTVMSSLSDSGVLALDEVHENVMISQFPYNVHVLKVSQVY